MFEHHAYSYLQNLLNRLRRMKKYFLLQEKSEVSHGNTMTIVIREKKSEIKKNVIFSNGFEGFLSSLLFHQLVIKYPIHDYPAKSDHELGLIDSRNCTTSAILGLLDGASEVQINPNLST